MRNFLSYISPITLKNIHTEKNGIMKILLSNWKKILNSAHANYSYWSLERILKDGLRNIDFSNINTVLVLGLGGGSVISTLRDDSVFSGKITAIEFDKDMIDIARESFGVLRDTDLEIIYMDAIEYIHDNRWLFDLIIIDLFIDTLIPDQLYEIAFWKDIYGDLNWGGQMLFNASMSNPIFDRLVNILEEMSTFFSMKQYDSVRGSNTLIVGKKRVL